MSLILRRNESVDDYSVIYRHPDGRELHAGRIFKTFGPAGSKVRVWMWTLEFHQRKWRRKNLFCAAKNPLKGRSLFPIIFRVNERRISGGAMMETSLVLTVSAVISVFCVLASFWIAGEA